MNVRTIALLVAAASSPMVAACSRGGLSEAGLKKTGNSADASTAQPAGPAGLGSGKIGTDPVSQVALNCLRDAVLEGATAGAVVTKLAYGAASPDVSYEIQVVTLSNGTTVQVKRLLKPDVLPNSTLPAYSYAGFAECAVDRSHPTPFTAETTCFADRLKDRTAKFWIVDYMGPIIQSDYLHVSFEDGESLGYNVTTKVCDNQ